MEKGPARDKIRAVLAAHAALPEGVVGRLADDTDLFQAGMASYASVNVMIGLEDVFGIEFPDSMLTRDVFRSVDSIASAVESLTESLTKCGSQTPPFSRADR